MASNLDSWNSFIGEPHVPTAQPILTKAFIEADYTCMTSQQITYYLERIWEYSSITTFVLPHTHGGSCWPPLLAAKRSSS